MANEINGNTASIDSTGALNISTARNIKIIYAILTPTLSGGNVVLQDNSSPAVNKVTLSGSSANDTKEFDWSRNPMVFPNGIKISAITNAKFTIVFTR